MSPPEKSNAQDFLGLGAMHDAETNARPDRLRELCRTSQRSADGSSHVKSDMKLVCAFVSVKSRPDIGICCRETTIDLVSTHLGRDHKTEQEKTDDQEDDWSMIVNLVISKQTDEAGDNPPLCRVFEI